MRVFWDATNKGRGRNGERNNRAWGQCWKSGENNKRGIAKMTQKGRWRSQLQLGEAKESKESCRFGMAQCGAVGLSGGGERRQCTVSVVCVCRRGRRAEPCRAEPCRAVPGRAVPPRNGMFSSCGSRIPWPFTTVDHWCRTCDMRQLKDYKLHYPLHYHHPLHLV